MLRRLKNARTPIKAMKKWPSEELAKRREEAAGSMRSKRPAEEEGIHASQGDEWPEGSQPPSGTPSEQGGNKSKSKKRKKCDEQEGSQQGGRAQGSKVQGSTSTGSGRVSGMNGDEPPTSRVWCRLADSEEFEHRPGLKGKWEAGAASKQVSLVTG